MFGIGRSFIVGATSSMSSEKGAVRIRVEIFLVVVSLAAGRWGGGNCRERDVSAFYSGGIMGVGARFSREMGRV